MRMTSSRRERRSSVRQQLQTDAAAQAGHKCTRTPATQSQQQPQHQHGHHHLLLLPNLLIDHHHFHQIEADSSKVSRRRYQSCPRCSHHSPRPLLQFRMQQHGHQNQLDSGGLRHLELPGDCCLQKENGRLALFCQSSSGNNNNSSGLHKQQHKHADYQNNQHHHLSNPVRHWCWTLLVMIVAAIVVVPQPILGNSHMTETPTSSSSSSSSSSSPLNTAASTSAAKSPLEELINNRIVRSYSEEFMSSSEERERGLQFFGSTGGSSAAVGGYSSLSAGGGVSPVHRHRIAPYFDTEEMNTNVTISEGSALVHLPCRVKQLGERTLSWIRKKDLQILTVGKYSYASDLRFNCKHMEGSDDWSLEISYPQKTDAGVYECQVATMPKMSQFVQLNVVVSKAKILEGPTLYLSSGSTLNLTCLVRDTPEPPDFIFWYFNGRVINYGSPRGIKVHTEKSTQTISRLTIAKAQPNDSGNYSCTPSNAEPAHIAVHINNNANPAASIQHGKRSAREFGTSGSGGGGSAHLALTTTVAACLATTIIQSAINNYYLQSQLWRRWRQPFPSLLSLPVYT